MTMNRLSKILFVFCISKYKESTIKTTSLIELLNYALFDHLWEILKEKSSRYGNPHWKKLIIHLFE